MFGATTTVPVRPCGATSQAWLPRPAHRATPALDALERDEEAWTERSVTAIRAGEGLPGLGYGADNDNGGSGDNAGGTDHHHHRILGFSVRNPEDLGLDRTVPPPPPLRVSEARIAAAEAAEAEAFDAQMRRSSLSWEVREAERRERAGGSSMPPPPPVMVRGSASVATSSGGSSVGDVAATTTPAGGGRRGRPGGRGTASSRRVVPARRNATGRGAGRNSTGSAAADTSELTADSEGAVHQPRSRRARATATTPASGRRTRWQRDPEMTAPASVESTVASVMATMAARERRPWQDDQDTTQEMEEDEHDDAEHSSMYSDDI